METHKFRNIKDLKHSNVIRRALEVYERQSVGVRMGVAAVGILAAAALMLANPGIAHAPGIPFH